MADFNWKTRNSAEVADLCKTHTLTNWRSQKGWEPRAVVAGGEGSYFWDVEGKRFLDFSSQYMCVNAGHQNPKIINAIKEQAEKICYVDPRHATHPRAELGRLLAEITPPNLNKFFICMSGSDANENALKIARMFSGRHKFISTYRSYHGGSFGASTLTGEYRRWASEPAVPGGIKVPAPYCYRCDFKLHPGNCQVQCARYIDQVIEYEGKENIAAVFVEGVIGANGILMPHRDDYLTTIREICTKKDVLMVVDEVMSGFGRTGEWFAVDHWRVQPDMITMAKGLTSSHIPLGAVGINDKISTFFDENVFWSGGTFASHPLSCAAAIGAIESYREDHLIDNAKTRGEDLSKAVSDLKELHPSVGDVRGIGLFQFIELVRNRNTKETFSGNTGTAGSKGDLGPLDQMFLDRGINVKIHPLGIYIIPPLCITPEELKIGLNAISEVIGETTDRWMS